MNPPVILCGLGLVGWRVLDHLLTLESPIVVIDTHADPTDSRFRHPDVTLIVGDCRKTEVLELAGLAGARGVVVLTSDDLLNISTALLVRRMNPTVRLVVRMFNQNLVSRLGKSVHNTVALSVSALSGPRLVLRALDRDVAAVYTNVQTGPERVADLRITADSPLNGRTIADVLKYASVRAVGHHPAGGEPQLLLDIDVSAKLHPGDRLMLAGQAKHLGPFLSGDTSDGMGVKWAGKLRRYTRLARRTFAELDAGVKIVGILLLLIVCGSTLFYYQILGRSFADSLYRSISVMATGADMRAGEVADSETAKVFTSVMRLVGVAMLAAFTAVLTNYLLRARLGGVLEVRRVPDGGHVVVCGLGNVGYRVVDELLDRDERVVVIERSPDGPFVSTCRRRGVAVIVGDASVPEVLRQARADSAKAVIVVTSSELVNLEVALLMGEINADQRVVVRLSDPLLADTLREAAHVPHAVSIPALAAPAFFAGLFDDRVQAVFRLGEQELAVLDLKVHSPSDPLTGQTLRSVAIDYNLVPLGVSSSASTAGPVWNADPEAANYRLKPGDVVTVATTGKSVSRLVRRERAEGEWSVRVTAFAIPAKTTLALWLRQTRDMSPEEAEQLLASVPFVLAPNQTRGQGEDWLRMLQRERVQGDLVRDGE